MRHEEARIRTAKYMRELRAERRAKQEVFHSLCRSQWARGAARRREEETAAAAAAEKARAVEEAAAKAAEAKRVETLRATYAACASPWEAIRIGAPIDTVRRKLSEEHARWVHQEKKVFDVNSRHGASGAGNGAESLLGCAVFFNRPLVVPEPPASLLPSFH
jgi:hypothetical protein